MGLGASNTGGGDFTPAPAGNHVARCISVIDLGTQHNDGGSYNGKIIEASDRHQVWIQWEIPGELVTIDGEEKPAVISQFYTVSLHDKAKLRAHLESWRGKAFTPEELTLFQLDKLLGLPCMLNVIHTPAGKAQISSVSSMPKGMTAPDQVNDSMLFDLDHFDQDKYEQISKGIQGIIARSPEYRQATGTTNGAATPPAHIPEPAQGFQDDEIPF